MRKFALVQSKDYFTDEDLHLFDMTPMPLYSLFSTKASKVLFRLVTWSAPAIIASIREALITLPASRSLAMQSNIMNMLLRTRGLSSHLTVCSQHNIEELAKACRFIHLASPGTLLANEGEYFDCCFIVLTGSVKVVTWRSKKYRKQQAAGLPDKINYKRHATTKVITKGVFVGEDALRGKHCWKSDVISMTKSTSICLLPIQSISKHIGMGNSKSRHFLECFWKHCQIWSYTLVKHEKAIEHHYDDGLSQKLKHVNSSSYFCSGADDSVDDSQHDKCGSVCHGQLHDISQQQEEEEGSCNVVMQEDMQQWLTRRAYIRCFRPGEVIFEQGSESHMLHVVMLGECAHIRALKYRPRPSSHCRTPGAKSRGVTGVESDVEGKRPATLSVKVFLHYLYMCVSSQ